MRLLQTSLPDAFGAYQRAIVACVSPFLLHVMRYQHIPPVRKTERNKPMQTRSCSHTILVILTVAILALVAIIAVAGCSVNVKRGDSISVQSIEMLRDRYRADILLAADKEEEDAILEEDFPIGSLTWLDFTTTMDGYKEVLKYEQDKLATENKASNENTNK